LCKSGVRTVTAFVVGSERGDRRRGRWTVGGCGPSGRRSAAARRHVGGRGGDLDGGRR